jgi:hypothetical protein
LSYTSIEQVVSQRTEELSLANKLRQKCRASTPGRMLRLRLEWVDLVYQILEHSQQRRPAETYRKFTAMVIHCLQAIRFPGLRPG